MFIPEEVQLWKTAWLTRALGQSIMRAGFALPVWRKGPSRLSPSLAFSSAFMPGPDSWKLVPIPRMTNHATGEKGKSPSLVKHHVKVDAHTDFCGCWI